MMQTTPVKRQATHNGILPSTPSSPFNSDNTRGQMANYTPEHLKAALASRPRSVRSSVSQGYATSPRTPLSATRSEPLITSNSHHCSPLYSPSSQAQLQYNRGLMPLCDTILDYSPSSSPHSRLSYDHSKNSILSKAQDALASYNSARSSASASSSAGSSARKRSQVDEDEDDEEEGDAQMALGMAVHGSSAMQEDSDMTMIAPEMEDDNDNDVPLSHSRSARRLNGSSTNTFNNNPFGSTTNQSFQTQPPISPLSFTSSPNNNNNAQSAAYGNGMSTTTTAIGGTNHSPLAQARRQLKTLPKRSNATAGGLNRTQSLPNESFFGNANAFGNEMIGSSMIYGEPVTAAQNMQIFPRDAFNATDF